MKKIIFTILITPLFVAAQQDVTGPYRLGDFVIGKTTVTDFYVKTDPAVLSFKVSENTEGFTIIDGDDSYYSYMESPSNDYFAYKKIFMLNPSYEGSFPQYPELRRINDKSKGFFINEMQFDKYVVNNICLQFFNDTLVFISYSGGDSVENVFIKKYKHQGHLYKTKETKSECKSKYKNGKPVMDKEDSFSLLNKQEDALTKASLIFEYDEDCNASRYINIEIYDSKRMKDWLEYCTASTIQKAYEFKAKRDIDKSKAIENF